MSALEAAAALAWPATTERSAGGGWLLRATPGLDRGRSNNALTPSRELLRGELDPAIEAVEAFAAEHSIRPGIQISPAGRPQPSVKRVGPARLGQAAADAGPHPPRRRDWPARADPTDLTDLTGAADPTGPIGSAGSEWADGNRSRQRRLAGGLGSLRART